MHDWNSAKLYSEKALKAAKGKNFYLKILSYWKISKKDKNFEISKGYNNLMIVYDDALF